MKKYILIFSLIFLLAKSAYAADADISCNENGCNPSTLSSFFPSDTWYPGRTVTKIAKITNTASVTRPFGVIPQNTASSNDIDTIMRLDIRDAGNNNLLWSDTLAAFYKVSETILTDISAGSSTEISFNIRMPQTAGDQYQNQTTSFDLILGFIEPTTAPTSTPGPTDTPTPTMTPPPGAYLTTSVNTFINQNNTYINTEGTNETANFPSGEILGSLSSRTGFHRLFGGMNIFCSDRKTWPLVLLTQLILTVFYLLLSKKEVKKLSLTGEILLMVSFFLFISRFLCNYWLSVISLSIGIAGLYLTYKKFPEKQALPDLPYLKINLLK